MSPPQHSSLESHEIIALAHRLALMAAIRKVVVVGFVIFLGFAIYRDNWWLIPISFVVAWLSAFLMSNLSANEVERITGMSHDDQARIWERYKCDAHFAGLADREIS